MGDGVRIDEQDAVNALSAWDSAAQSLDYQVMCRTSEILAAFDGAKWAGNDEAGEQFREALDLDRFEKLFGPATRGDELVSATDIANAVVTLGKNVRTAVKASLTSDASQAQEVKYAQEQL